MLQLSPSPPFSLWVTLNEFTATRDLVRTQADTQALAMGELRTLLTMALSGTPAGPNRCREQLQLVAREVLDEPLLRSRVPSITSPTVRDGFVEPSFQFVQAGADERRHDESWWSRQPEYSSLVGFLASYLASPDSTMLPLLLLGHPGAGKSLLTEVLAAQLPSASFAVVRVPLRSVDPEDDLTSQISEELQRTLRRQLQYAAIGRFNRGRQHLTDAELDTDLAALSTTGVQTRSAAGRVLGEFMFVHNARADRERRNAYEFLHATFGEFLVAELVLDLLHELTRTPEPAPGLDDTVLRRLLSHQPLSTRGPILRFIEEHRYRSDDAGQVQPLRAVIRSNSCAS